MRDAIGFCKLALYLDNKQKDTWLTYTERNDFEKCLTQNFLVKNGLDYFGKRDLIYLDLVSTDNVRELVTPNVRWSDDDKPFHNTKVFDKPEVEDVEVPEEFLVRPSGDSEGKQDDEAIEDDDE